MKACPYCAEMIQDAAAKCRFCGEWLDPTKRPDYASAATSAPSAPAAPVAASQRPPREAKRIDPNTTTTDGSVHEAREGQSWAAPAWMTASKRPAPGSEGSETPQGSGSSEDAVDETAATMPPTVAKPASAQRPMPPAPESFAPQPEPEPEPEAGLEDGASLEEVALRMRRIKASAAAVRDAVRRESESPDLLGDPDHDHDHSADDDDDEAAITMHAGQSSDVLPAEHDPDARNESHDGFIADSDDVDGDDDDDDDDGFDDDEFAALAEPKADDDALPAGLGGFGDFDDFGDDDDDDDDDDFGGDFGDVGASRPIPWRPVAIGAAVVLVIGIAMFWGRIFPSEAAVEDDAVAQGESGGEADASADEKAPADAKPEAAPPAPGEGQPVVPEGGTPAPAAVGAPAAGDPANPGAAPAAPAGAVPGATPDPADPTAAPADPAAIPAGAAPDAVPTAGAVPAGTPAAATPLDAATLAQLEEARKLYRGGGKRKLKQSKEILDGIVAAQPNNPDALVVLAQVELELGNPDAALATATKCTQVSAQTADCWLTIGVLKQDSKDSDAAIEAYERYLALAPEGAYAGQVSKQLKRLK